MTSMINDSVPPSIAFAVTFLSAPLMSAYPTHTVQKIQSTLLTELLALHADQVAKSPEWQIYLNLSPSTLLPPRPLLTACIASGVKWSRWILHLGGKEMMFGLSSKAVVLAYPLHRTFLTLWQAPMSADEVQDFKAMERWEKWMPPTPTSSGCNNPEEIPVSAPLSSAAISALSDVWQRPDSPSKDSVWSDSDDELEDWEKEVLEVHSGEETD